MPDPCSPAATSLTRLTWPLAARARRRILVVPLGATEQHGPHLPLTTDTDIACALAGRLAARLPDTIAVAPPVPYGSSGEHQDFAGSLSIGQEATELLVVELARSATCTWPRVLLLTTHGGNTEPVGRAVERLRGEGRDVRAWGPTWEGDAHAGHIETSVMLALHADRLRMDRVAAGAREPIGQLLGRLRREGVRAVSRNGILGDATTASARSGEALLAGAVADLVSYVESWPGAAVA